jgi:two-component system response regulator MprA
MVLDVMLPGVDGFEVARRLRRENNRVPILMLTARDAVQDRVKGLDLGADDYLNKPFSFVELLARVREVSRRGPVPQATLLRISDLTLDPSSREVFRGSRPISLTKTEYALLEFLLRNAGRVLPRNTIIEAVWGLGENIENNTLDAFVKLLRNKIDAGRRVKLIHTVRGFGYVLREAAEP